MEHKSEHLTIGAFARAAGASVETIRFYQRKGLRREFNQLTRQQQRATSAQTHATTY